MSLHRIHFWLQVFDCLARGRLVSSDAIREDYDRLSSTYDGHFSLHMAPYSAVVIDRLRLVPGARVLDLACGTGALTFAAADRVGPEGSVLGMDRSFGMLSMAEARRRRGGHEQVRFLCADMTDGLRAMPAATFDAVTCGWAIGYAEPDRLLREVHRVLKPGGVCGLIENRRRTLLPIRRAAVRVAQTLPGHLEWVMDLHRRLPAGRGALVSLFRRAGLQPVQVWDGCRQFTFQTGADVLRWVLHTGASAGFDRMMAASVRERCDALFVHYIERDHLTPSGIRVSHCFVAGIAAKEEA